MDVIFWRVRLALARALDRVGAVPKTVGSLRAKQMPRQNRPLRNGTHVVGPTIP